jgi:release factor glutamine methyltransferase
VATVRELLEEASRRLREAGVEAPRREADLLLSTLLGMSASALLARDHEIVEPAAVGRFRRRVDRRADGEPAAYLLGHREFWGRDFVVDARVLIPRPETEHLVELALDLPLPETASVLDVGTGSGCVGVTLAAERAAWRVIALDRSVAALAVARRNAARHGVGARLDLLAADLLAGLALERLDLVVANLPYLGAADRLTFGPALAHEPASALYAGERGTELVLELCRQAAALRPGAYLALEIGAAQSAELLDAIDRTVWEPSAPRRDLAGLERNLILKRRAPRAHC